ncbi:MAG: hypothetical protein NC095_08200 [Muribaculum sp.]|nr:hypothetical protein [Muribaculum sp.]
MLPIPLTEALTKPIEDEMGNAETSRQYIILPLVKKKYINKGIYRCHFSTFDLKLSDFCELKRSAGKRYSIINASQ